MLSVVCISNCCAVILCCELWILSAVSCFGSRFTSGVCLFAVASPAMGHWGTCTPPPLTSKSESQLSKYRVVFEISWCRCQQLTALLISTALVTKLLVIEQLVHPTPKSTVSAPWHNFNLCLSSQQILATPLSVCLSFSVCLLKKLHVETTDLFFMKIYQKCICEQGRTG